ncbi:uncharacterized protein LOC125025148 [Penaeus chinensis]|uniref:uncharacterized protein LOC125025148 n=1 Tax=Penaeus chinensis TaxID=139456 RepID=UPI001FB82B86|nr:uncharacterized protein LOC125025148 [Penaeus chinensis]
MENRSSQFGNSIWGRDINLIKFLCFSFVTPVLQTKLIEGYGRRATGNHPMLPIEFPRTGTLQTALSQLATKGLTTAAKPSRGITPQDEPDTPYVAANLYQNSSSQANMQEECVDPRAAPGTASSSSLLGTTR